MNRTLAVLCLLVALCGTPSGADDDALNLPIGDPARTGHQAPLVLDAITDTRTGEVIGPAELPARLDGVRLLFIGESHLNMDSHVVEQRVIQALQESGRRVLVGIEMYPYTEQTHLDRWADGLLTEAGFLQLSRWYEHWGYHWDYYRDVFLYARDHGIRMAAVNTPRSVVRAVRTKGFENLTPEEAAHIPTRIDTDSEEHRRLFRAFFTEEDAMHSSMTEQQWDGMYKAQCTWEASMAHNAVRALQQQQDDRAIMVVLIGSGHVAYGLGAERQARLWFQGKTASLIPVPVVDEHDQPVAVRASYADFVWGCPKETGPLHPVLGLSTRQVDQALGVIHVEKRSVAAVAGFRLGDELVSMDGVRIGEQEDLKRLLAQKRWGDAGSFEVRRGGELVRLTAQFRRTPPEPKKP